MFHRVPLQVIPKLLYIMGIPLKCKDHSFTDVRRLKMAGQFSSPSIANFILRFCYFGVSEAYVSFSSLGYLKCKIFCVVQI